MKKRILVSTAILAIGVSIAGMHTASAATTITKVYDGDTITLSTGEKVRFLQIDTPELSPTECYGKEARQVLINLLNNPGQLSLKKDPKLDEVDRYGRLLRYVFIGKTNINLKLVEIGAAAPYFYKGDRGQFANQLLKAAKEAKSRSLGLWNKCPQTKLVPNLAVTTSSPSITGGLLLEKNQNCDPNYKECIPVYPPDINCSNLKRLRLAQVHVVGKDVHKLDRDGNGVGCDS